jgi:hypothetical protein
VTIYEPQPKPSEQAKWAQPAESDAQQKARAAVNFVHEGIAGGMLTHDEGMDLLLRRFEIILAERLRAPRGVLRDEGGRT